MKDEALESASATVMRGLERGSHLFVVENYSLSKGIGVNKSIESEEFVVGGYQWTIRLYPGGKTVDISEAGMASLYIFLRSKTDYPVPCVFDMHILDQSGKGNDWGFSFMDKKLRAFSVSNDVMKGIPEFISRASLDSPVYLRDDCLKIRVSLGVLTSRVQNLPLIKVPKRNIGAELGKLLQSKLGADVFFKVKNETFCAHKWILAARCPLFLSHLSDYHQSKEINIPDTDPKIFEAVLWFVYTGTLVEEELDDCDFGPSMLASYMGRMLAAADRFKLGKLKKICESRISKRISGESVAYLLHLAELCDAKELKAACLRFGAEKELSLLDFMDYDGCKYLKETCPVLFLEVAYKRNGWQGRGSYNKVFSVVKESFVGLLGPQCATDRKHKIKQV